MEDLRRFARSFNGIEEGLDNEVRGVPHADVPTDDLARKNVDDGGNVDESASPGNVREVPGPEDVRLNGTDMLGEIWYCRGRFANIAWLPRLAEHDLWPDAKLLHDAMDPFTVEAEEQCHPSVAIGWVFFAQGHDLLLDLRVFLGLLRAVVQGLTGHAELPCKRGLVLCFRHTRPTFLDFFPHAFP